MLILTRKVDEGIMIGDNIRIRVIGIEGNKVKLGIIADKNISVIREEIIEAVKKENQSAGNVDEALIDWTLIVPPED